MMEARVAGVPRPVSFMASESSFSSSVLPAVSMAVRSVASVKRLGGARLLLERPRRRPRPAAGRARGRRAALARRPQLLRSRLGGGEIEDLPADLVDEAAGGVIAIDDGRRCGWR